jgi:hypothetical protein
MFDGIKEKMNLKLTKTRAFANGNVVLWYKAVTENHAIIALAPKCVAPLALEIVAPHVPSAYARLKTGRPLSRSFA